MMSRDELEFDLRIAQRELRKANEAVGRAMDAARRWQVQIRALEAAIVRLREEVPAERV